MGAWCSRRKQTPQGSKEASRPKEIKEIEAVISAAGGKTVKLQLGVRYKTGGELRARAAALFHVPQEQAVLMCGGMQVTDEEEVTESLREALSGKPPHLQLLRKRRHMAVSATHAGAIQLWDVERGEISKPLPNEHLSGIWSLDVHWESARMASAADDNTVKIWDLDRVKTTTMRGHSDSVTNVSVDWDKGLVLTSSMDSSLKMWDLQTLSCTKTLEGHSSGVQCLSVHWVHQVALSGSWDKSLKLWDLESGGCSTTLEGHDSFIICLKVDWAASVALSGARGHITNKVCKGYDRMKGGGSNVAGKNLKLWDLDNGVCLKTFHGHDKDIYGVDMCWASKRGLIACADKLIHLWDLEAGEVLRSFAGHVEFVGCVKADWSARRVLSGAGNHELRLWDLDSGECLSTWSWDSGDTRMGRGQVRTLVLEPFPSTQP